MPQIKDRREAYKERHRAIGLCEKCRSNALPWHIFCFRHWLMWHLAKRRLTTGPLTEKNKKLRSLLITHLQARYFAIQAGERDLTPKTELLRESVELRLRLGIGWGGVRGVSKLASIIAMVERYAVRDREAEGAE